MDAGASDEYRMVVLLPGSGGLLTPAEIKAIFIERAGGATNAAAMDEKFAADVLAGLAEAAEKKSA